MMQRAKRIKDKEELQEFRRKKLLEKERKKTEEEKKKEQREEEERLEKRRKQAADAEKILQEEERMAANAKKNDTPHRSHEAKRKYLSRTRKKLSPNATIFADTICDLVIHSTPRRRKALQDKGIKLSKTDIDSIITTNVALELKKDRNKRDKKTRLVRRRLASSLHSLKMLKKQHLAKKTFSATPKLLANLKKQEKYNNPFSIPNEVKVMVRSFYEDEATQLPNKKNVSKKTLRSSAVLQRPISSLFKEFKQANPEVEIKKSSFFMLRPKHIKPMGFSTLRGCLCEWCRNIHLKVSTINALCAKFTSSSSCRLKDEFFASNLSLCPKHEDQKYHELACIQRQCSHCGVKLLQDQLQPLVDEAGTEYPTEWSRWGLKKTGTVNKMVLSSKTGTLCDLLTELYEEMQGYAAHLFQWFWQHGQYTNLIRDPLPNTLVAVLDFAENYSNIIQDEVQAAHWGHEQTTIHPIVCTYRCKCHNEPVSHSMVYISDDKKHDYHSVHKFSEHCVNHLRNAHGVDIKQVIRFSDGCAAQYKSRGAFLDIAQAELPTEHHFFGARHGKGPSDGESAVVKQKASMAVRTSTARIPDALSLYKFAKEELTRNDCPCMPFKREFFFIPLSDINHERPCPSKAVKDTRKIACVKNGGGPLELFHRTLSCFCINCMTKNGDCLNKDYVSKWTSTQLLLPDNTPVKPAVGEKNNPGAMQTSSTADTSQLASVCTTTSGTSPDELAEEAVSEENLSSGPAVHDFVTVRVPVYRARKNRSDALFIAQVASVEGGNVRLQYMRQQSGDLYSWPDGEAKFYVHPLGDIDRILPQPETVINGSRIFLKFIN
nr:uncharacterized protein LOC129268919 [Lytechinus pictus]